MDVDVYHDIGGKIEVYGMRVDIQIILERMRHKDPSLVRIDDAQTAYVNTKHRLYVLKHRNKPPMIYHGLNVTRGYSTLNIQVKTWEIIYKRLVLLVRHGKMPQVDKCDFVKVVTEIDLWDGKTVIMHFRFRFWITLYL